MKKFIVIAFMALAVTMIATVPAKASDVTPTVSPTPTPAPRVSSLVPPGNGSGGRISVGTIFDYYNNVLTADQRQIADYLIGMYNYMYISARGFSYTDISVTDDLINRLRSFGNRFWGTTLEGNASRLDPYMQQFLSAVISYAGTIDSSFNTWVSSLNGSNLVIPFTKDSLNSWTNYYNDPSALGVENWGSYESNWESGAYYDYAFGNYGFQNGTMQSTYNNFIINNSPVLYTNVKPVYDYQAQNVFSLANIEPFNSLYVQRGNNNKYQFYKFGTTDRVFSEDIQLTGIVLNLDNGVVSVYNSSSYYKLNAHTFDSGEQKSISEIINYAFHNTPIIRFQNNNRILYFEDCYPFISHVYLVDDLDILSNKVEIFNVDDMGIDSSNAIWINEPTNDDLYWQIEPTLIQGDEWDDNLVHVDLAPVDQGDITKNVVNNTVINNYEILAPGSIINVPGDWLDSDGNYLEYTNNTALPFFVMVGDIFNALGEIRVFIVGVLILGLAGGVLVKFLL